MNPFKEYSLFLLPTRLILALLPLTLAGCSSMPSGVHPNLSHPSRALTTTPTVELMGDEQPLGISNFAANPMWSCQTCAAGQISADTLTRVPDVIARHPDVVIIQTGANDIADNLETSRTQPTFGNIVDMLDAFDQAGITAVISELPSSTAYDPYYLNEGLDLEYEAGLIKNLLIIQDNDQLTDGIPYTQAGLESMFPQFYQKAESFGLGGTK